MRQFKDERPWPVVRSVALARPPPRGHPDAQHPPPPPPTASRGRSLSGVAPVRSALPSRIDGSPAQPKARPHPALGVEMYLPDSAYVSSASKPVLTRAPCKTGPCETAFFFFLPPDTALAAGSNAPPRSPLHGTTPACSQCRSARIVSDVCQDCLVDRGKRCCFATRGGSFLVLFAAIRRFPGVIRAFPSGIYGGKNKGGQEPVSSIRV